MALVLVLVLIALNLRTTVASLPPLATEIEETLDISGAAVGLLTSLPVVCMAVFAAAAHRLASAYGPGRVTLVAIGCVAVGNSFRLAGENFPLLLAATLTAGIGIAAAGVLQPALIKAAFARRSGAITGACSTAMILGASIAGVMAVPLDAWLGSWQASLAVWGLPALFALAISARTVPRLNLDQPEVRPGSASLPWRAPGAWLLAGFFALQAALAYAYLAWIPPAYEARGWEPAATGGLLGLLHLAQLVTALSLPAIADRTRDPRTVLFGAASLTVAGSVWLFALPEVLPWLATTVLGLGLGGGFSLTVMLIVEFAADPRSSGGLAALVFMVGYAAAALTPIAVGALRDISGGLELPFGLLVLVSATQLATAARLGPHRFASVRT